MRHIYTGILTAVLALAAAPGAFAADAKPPVHKAMAVAAAWEDGSLLLDNGEGFPLLVVEHAAVIHDARGTVIALRDIRAGDRVEYATEAWAGMSLATDLRVTSPFTAEVR